MQTKFNSCRLAGTVVFERLANALTSESVLNELTNRINAMIKNSNWGKSDDKERLEHQLQELEAQIKRIQHSFESGMLLYTEDEPSQEFAKNGTY